MIPLKPLNDQPGSSLTAQEGYWYAFTPDTGTDRSFASLKNNIMSKSGPIVIIEDDTDDKQIFEDALSELGIKNKLVWFREGDEAFDYLKSTTDQPFLIFSDINLPKQNGIEFKRQIDSDPELRKKSIPFVFYTTTADQELVNEAYIQLTVQGFFKKNPSYAQMKNDLKNIFEYWQISKHPNSD